MKSMRLLIGALVALSMFSCAKKEVVETGEQGGYLKYFAPDLSGASYLNESSKASVSVPDGTVVFEDGDQVVLSNGSVCASFRYSASRNLFLAEGDMPLGSTITALYPADIFSSLSSDGKMNVNLPTSQIYLSNQVLKAPMSGTYADGKVSFRGLCTILNVPLTGEETISSASFVANQVGVCGAGVLNGNALVMDASADKSVTMDAQGTSLAQGVSLYFVVPSQRYTGGFSINVNMANGNVFSVANDADLTLSPGYISAIDAVACTKFAGGHGTEESPYLIASPAHLLELRDLIDSDEYDAYCDKHYLQVADLDFANFNNGMIRVIGTEENQIFKGVYDGGNFKIQNGAITRSYNRVGLFGSSSGATFKNIIFENCNIPDGDRSVGYVVGLAQAGTTIDNCHVFGGTATSTWTGIGSIAGEMKESSLSNCTSSATIQGSNGTKYSGAGGIVGYIDKGISTVSDCTFSGKVVALYNEQYPTTRAHNVGGIVGNIWDSPSVVSNCQFTGSLSGRAGYMGGIVGHCSSAATIDNCHANASAKIEGSKEALDTALAIGGIVGGWEINALVGEIRKCSFAGTVKGSHSGIGGIIGYAEGPAKVLDCAVLNGAKIEGPGFAVGGIVGNSMYKTATGMVRNCSVTGATISSSEWGVGGIVARNYGLQVAGCQVKNTTISTQKNNAGGITGVTHGNMSYADCTVEQCTVSATELLAAGVVAEINNSNNGRVNIRNCHIKNSSFKAKYYVGGVAGNVKAPALVDQCFVEGTDVTSTNGGEAGGVLGKTAFSGILVANSMYCGGSVVGSTSTSGIGGIVGSFYSENGLTSGKSLSTTTIVNCMSNPKLIKNTNTISTNALLGGVAGHMAYTRMVNSYSTVSAATTQHAGTDAEGKWGTLFGYMIYGGEVINGYWIEDFKAGYANPSYTYTQKIQKARDTQMRQNDETSNVFWVPSEYPDGEYRQANMVAALNKGAAVYNATAGLYGVQAKNWVMTSAYDYPVIAGSPLDNGSTTVQKKRVAILGDSISTFQDWSNNVSNYQYPKSGVYEDFKVQDTYWYQLIYQKMSNAELDVNSSYCGSTVQNNASKGKPSFISRYSDLRSPDVILINGGTNDSWSYKLPLGTLDFDLSLDQLDTYQFAQAYDKLIRLLKRDYPSAKIFLIIGDCLRDFPTYTKVITDLAAHYNLKTAQITFADRTTMTYQRTGTSDVNVHPNKAGMKEMADQIWNQLKNDL